MAQTKHMYEPHQLMEGAMGWAPSVLFGAQRAHEEAKRDNPPSARPQLIVRLWLDPPLRRVRGSAFRIYREFITASITASW